MAAGPQVLVLLLLSLTVAQALALECPDGTTCREGSTCCQLKGGDYGCCQFKDAECCPYQNHCCPHGYSCGPNSTCTNDMRTFPMAKKYASFKPNTPVRVDPVFINISRVVSSFGDIVCPDGNVCDPGSTCCEMTDEEYGCCPYVNAVCCSDKVHCCPSGFRCNTAERKCLLWQEVKSMALQQPAKTVEALPEGQFVKCPDKSICGDGSTCCLSTTGGYSCCPYSNAECCSDNVHCCPEGYRCLTSRGSCVRVSTRTVAKKMFASISRGLLLSLQSQYVQCPDQSYCPNGNTCCLLTTGHYGCCPFDHAECCSDHRSCCPEGYRCQVSTRTCTKGSTSIEMSEKRPSLPVDVLLSLQSQFVQCPDQSYCPNGNTCCLMTTGHYGCCPHVHAECCSDHRSCCPEGYRCQVSTGSCTKGSTNIAMSEKRPSLSLETALVSLSEPVLCAGNATRCAEGSTCCPSAHGGYDCCPYKDAECCYDGVHCCSKGYHCDSTGACIIGSSTTNWQKLPVAGALLFQSVFSSEATCADQTRCPGSRTCCKTADGKYGCCPFPEAMCCGDGTHCCPRGHQCNLAEGTCESEEQNEVVPMPKKLPSTPAP